MQNSARDSISKQETGVLLKRCTEEATNKYVAKILGVGESRISEGKNCKWTLTQEQKKILIREFGFAPIYKGRYLLAQRTQCFHSMLSYLKAFDLYWKTDEYFTSDLFSDFLTEIDINKLLEHKTARDWFIYVNSHQKHIMNYTSSRKTQSHTSVLDIFSTKSLISIEDLSVTLRPPTCINLSAGHDLDSPPKYIDEQQESDENARSMFNLCKDYFEGNSHDYEDKFWPRLYLLSYLKGLDTNVTELLSRSHDERCKTSESEIVFCGRKVWSGNGRFDLHENILLGSLINESWARQVTEVRRLKIDSCQINIELLITESNRYFCLFTIILPRHPEESKKSNLTFEFLTEEIDKSIVLNELSNICSYCDIKQNDNEIRTLLAHEGALIPSAEYIY